MPEGVGRWVGSNKLVELNIYIYKQVLQLHTDLPHDKRMMRYLYKSSQLHQN